MIFHPDESGKINLETLWLDVVSASWARDVRLTLKININPNKLSFSIFIL